MTNQKNIVIVEDDETTRMMMEESLKNQGFPVKSFPNAEEAWGKLKEKNTQLLFLDISLPGMSGIELCEKIRKELKDNEIYIIAATGKDKPEELKEILETGVNDYIAKPINPKILVIRTQVAKFTLNKIAERKEFEKKLIESEERHRIISQNGRDVVTTCKNNGEITYINQAVENLLGYNQTGMVGKNLRDFIHHEDRKHALPTGEEIFNGTLEGTTEFRMETAEGQFIWVDAVHRPIQSKDGNDIQEWITYIRESQANKGSETRSQMLEEILDGENLETGKTLEKIAQAFSGKAILLQETPGGKTPYVVILQTGGTKEHLQKAIELLWQGERQEEKITSSGQNQHEPYLIQNSLGLLAQENHIKGKYPWQSGMIQTIPESQHRQGNKKLIILKPERIEERDYRTMRVSLKMAAGILGLKLAKEKL